MIDIVERLERIIDKARDGMPRVGVDTLYAAVDEIKKLRREARDPVEAQEAALRKNGIAT
jgi:hypothetical protein